MIKALLPLTFFLIFGLAIRMPAESGGHADQINGYAFPSSGQDTPRNFHVIAGTGLNVLPGDTTLVRDRDGNTYPTVRLAGRTWLAKNLNLNVPDSWCYDDDPANCAVYGRLYLPAAAAEACAALGDGWRLPNKEEWAALAMEGGGYLDFGAFEVGDPAKGHQYLLKGGESGFGALLGGWRINDANGFGNLEELGFYWTAVDEQWNAPWFFRFFHKNGQLAGSYNPVGRSAYSCRCVRD